MNAKTIDNSKRNKRAVVILLIAGVLICLFNFIVTPFTEKWSRLEDKIVRLEKKAQLLEDINNNHQEGLLTFKLPAGSDEQLILFASETENIFRKSGIKLSAEPKYVSNKGRLDKGIKLKIYNLKMKGTARFQQIIDLLFALRSNPYLLAIEEFEITRDKKNRNKVHLSMTLSTMAG